jgi:hypothetical protein
LWRLDTASGGVTLVSTDAQAMGVFVGATPLQVPPTEEYPDAWWTTVSWDSSASSDPYVYFQYLSAVAGQHAEDWFKRPGSRMNVVGVDAHGHAVVLARSPSQVELWLLSTPDSASQIYSAANGGGSNLPFKTAVADHGGWWIGSSVGMFFATTTAFTQVSSTPSVAVGGCNPN